MSKLRDGAHYRDEAIINGKKYSNSSGQLFGVIEMSTMNGDIIFSKDIYTNDLLVNGAVYLLEKAYGVRSTFAPSTIEQDLGIVTDVARDVNTLKEERVIGIVCGIGGCTNTYNTVRPVYRHHKNVPDMIPFRTLDVDFTPIDREPYFLRVQDGDGTIKYYGKKFQDTPEIKVFYEDGVFVPNDVDTLINPKPIDTYAESKLFISKDDFREFFIHTDGNTNLCRINSIGLVVGSEYIDSTGNVDYANVRCITTLNSENKDLKNSEAVINITYRQYLI